MNRTIITRSEDFKVREDEQDLYIEGYFAVFDDKYHICDGGYETIDKEAFKDLSNEQDIRCLINHDTTLVVGRTTAGTLELNVDDKGLYGKVKVNRNDQDAMNVYARVQRGDVNQCSFGFEILDEKTEIEDGITHWTLLNVRVHEVSICTFPAYEKTIVEAREKQIEENKQKELEAWKNKQLAKLKKEN